MHFGANVGQYNQTRFGPTHLKASFCSAYFTGTKTIFYSSDYTPSPPSTLIYNAGVGEMVILGNGGGIFRSALSLGVRFGPVQKRVFR